MVRVDPLRAARRGCLMIGELPATVVVTPLVLDGDCDEVGPRGARHDRDRVVALYGRGADGLTGHAVRALGGRPLGAGRPLLLRRGLPDLLDLAHEALGGRHAVHLERGWPQGVVGGGWRRGYVVLLRAKGRPVLGGHAVHGDHRPCRVHGRGSLAHLGLWRPEGRRPEVERWRLHDGVCMRHVLLPHSQGRLRAWLLLQRHLLSLRPGRHLKLLWLRLLRLL